MATFLFDNFTGTAGAELSTLTVGANRDITWALHPNSTGLSAVISDANRARGAVGTPHYIASAVPPSANYRIPFMFKVKSLGGAGLGAYVLGRLSPTSTSYYAAGLDDDGTWYLYKQNPSYVELGTWLDSTLSDEDTRSGYLEIGPNSQKLYVEGVLRISATDSAITAAGRVGIIPWGAHSNTTGIHIDSIEASVPIVGTSAAMVPGPSVTAASTLRIKGTIAKAIPGPVLSATASTSRSGVLAGKVPSPSLSATGTIDITGAATPTVPGPRLSGVGTLTTGGFAFAITDPFSVSLARAISAPFDVQAVAVGPGPLREPSLDATGALLIQGELAGTVPGPVLEATGIGPGAILDGTLPLPVLSATGVLAQSDRVFIGGVLVRVYEDPPLEIDDWIEERSTARFDVRDDEGILSFLSRQPVEIYDHTGDRIFGGYLDTVREVRLTQAGAKRHILTCVDNHYRADKRRVAASYENQTVEAVVEDLVTDYLEDEDVTLASALIDPGPVIGQAIFSYRPLSECLQTIADRVNYWWRIDHDGVFHFRERGTETASWSLTGADIIGTPAYSRSSTMYRNRQFIRGPRDLTDPQTFGPVAGDGVAREWTMGFPLAKVPTVEVNGTPATVDLKMFAGEHTADFYWQKGDPVIVQDSGGAVLTGTDDIEVTYQGEFNLVVASEDTAAILAQQALEGGGSGIVEAVDDDASLGTRTAALEKAAALLKKYGIAGEQLSFVTLRSGLQPGMVQTVTLPAHDLDGDELLVSHINTQRIRTAEGFMYRRTVTEIYGPSIGSWAKFFLRLTQAPSFIDRLSVGEEGTLAILHSEAEEIHIDEDVTFHAAACSFPSTSLFPDTDIYPC